MPPPPGSGYYGLSKPTSGHYMAEDSHLNSSGMPFSVSFPLLFAAIYNLPGGFLSNPNKTVLKFKKQNEFPATFLDLDELLLRCGRSSTCEFSEIHLVRAPYCTHGISMTTLARFASGELS